MEKKGAAVGKGGRAHRLRVGREEGQQGKGHIQRGEQAIGIYLRTILWKIKNLPSS